MSEAPTLLAVFAHPDDESLVLGGTLARYAAEGWRTALLCATRGDWGPISDEALADYSNLGSVRESELRAACAVLGIGWLRLLDIEDACVEAVLGTPDETAVLAKIVLTLRELRPALVVTFGPDGLYGHPDHIAIGQLTTTACRLAGDDAAFPEQLMGGLTSYPVPELFYATAPQSYYAKLVAALGERGLPAELWGLPAAKFGVAESEIDLTLDITLYLPQKLAALRCHRTQLDATHALAHLSEELAAQYFHHEFLKRASLAGGDSIELVP
ncbi:MAG: PIG-L family deacetylase [Acidobacteria bacterium]|nr:PIG-L family deacetylase [Acidobacteriota bacterium]MBI3426213.1 PIG-L family deacetylase [Acidobacteriota bacterium]